jgi:Ran GTPase-activating protein (RanGAP) involved in mRNA processing and transport
VSSQVFRIDFYDGTTARPKMRTQAWVESVGGAAAMEEGKDGEEEGEDEEREKKTEDDSNFKVL